jgi:hypothetical protein
MVTQDPSEFDLATEDLSSLEIRDSGNHTFYYFFDKTGKRLIKRFVLEHKPQVTTLCDITLIKKGGELTRRIQAVSATTAAS